ncbi:MAG: hypothetical protein JNM38_01015 [Acidobacteria bacterium]|jgi:hypothetical protein|nr:hypothetical protein [Acidobacteriota bacterium]
MILNEPTPEQLQAIDGSLYDGNMLEALSQYRTLTGGSLVDAKQWAEARLRALQHAHPEKFPAVTRQHHRAIAMAVGAVALVAVTVAAIVLR